MSYVLVMLKIINITIKCIAFIRCVISVRKVVNRQMQPSVLVCSAIELDVSNSFT